MLQDDEFTSDEEESEELQRGQVQKRVASRPSGGISGGKPDDDLEEERAENDDDALETWGGSKRDYYNQDEIETERDAVEEEEEARRLQQKRLKRRSEADFGFDDTAWLVDGAPTAQADDAAADGRAVTEVLPRLDITDAMGVEERMRILDLRHPEFGPLSKEFLQLQPIHADLKAKFGKAAVPAGQASGIRWDVLSAKYYALTAYLGALSMYFALLTSMSVDGSVSVAAMDPSELRDHPIMEGLFECRKTWESFQDIDATVIDDLDKIEMNTDVVAPNGNAQPTKTSGRMSPDKHQEPKPSRKRKRKSAREAAQLEAEKQLAEKIRKTEEELADLSRITNEVKARPAQASSTNVAKMTFGVENDFAEDTALDPIDAAEKAQKKKTLRFYTSQIAQKANKRSNAGRDAGGDADLPYRERLKDRQARLNAQAEKRGKRNGRDDDPAEALSGGSDDEGEQANRDHHGRDNDGDEEYYDLIANAKRSRKAAKTASLNRDPNGQAYKAAEEEETIGPDGKRAITYQIEKNKGLTPKRKKEVRNPRVKKRKKFAEKQKKLGSVRQLYRGGEQQGGYAGEATGIKTRLVKSVKL